MKGSESDLMIPDEFIMNKIFLIRGKKVMLDRDLAELYEIETKQLKRAVRRNISRFPEDFMFELTTGEFKNLRSQFGTSSWGGSRYLRQLKQSKKQELDYQNRKRVGSKEKTNNKSGQPGHTQPL